MPGTQCDPDLTEALKGRFWLVVTCAVCRPVLKYLSLAFFVKPKQAYLVFTEMVFLNVRSNVKVGYVILY